MASRLATVTLALCVLLITDTRFDARAQSEEEEEFEEEEVGEELEEVETGSTGAEFGSHPQFTECIGLMEEVEAQHGFFDEADAPVSVLAENVAKHAVTITSKQSPTFQGLFMKRMQDVLQKRSRGDDQAALGAADVCSFLLQHHDEL
eukprot:TRINITY_DN61624_c0_g1_i1.p1 TRINITY_DN61624_c0_g1~~TRINITY_DN61624_c0_g1_i1.p1  ORF type:complete len:148 (-),score=31.49 TRINITY_DN61624_c0_g1_i1:54-497(-)